jgi:hypothetical protein
MVATSLEDALKSTIHEWFGGATIDVHSTLDALVAVMASIAVKAGCNTDERSIILMDHLKSNLTAQLSRERTIATASRAHAVGWHADSVERVTTAARRALDTGEPIRVEGEARQDFIRKLN